MKRSRLVLPSLLAVTVVCSLAAGSLNAVAPAQPASSAAAQAPARAKLRHSAPVIPTGRWAAGSPALAQLSEHRPSPARPAVRHLAPQLNRLAGVAGAPSSDAGVPLEQDGTAEVTVTGPAAVAAARAVGARVLASYGGSSTVAVDPARLRSLAGQPGVTAVTPAVRAMPQSTSQGVAASGAQAWAENGNVGNGGAGVKVGIVDAGFKGLQDEIAAGNFNDPDGHPVTVVYPTSQNHCVHDDLTAHGTAVSEIVHQMAPRATLYLYCINDNIGFAMAASQVRASGVKIVNSSLAFSGESRGDGYGAATTSERAVRTAREAGVLWIQSSGNSAMDHWSGTLTDADHDRLVDLDGPAMSCSAGINGRRPRCLSRWRSASTTTTTPRSARPGCSTTFRAPRRS
jgi:hypothetical protein